MNSRLYPWIDLDPEILGSSGVHSHAIATLDQVDSNADRLYADWIAKGYHGAMAYLEKYPDIRRDPRLLLDGARSMIICAIPYFTPFDRSPGSLSIARYALGRDYHDVVRRRLEAIADAIRARYGGETRVCVDTAPLRERYWAQRAGLGFIGLNNQLIIPGAGSYFFLGEILTTVAFNPTAVGTPATCQRCGRCIKACPTGALNPDGSCDASRCLSYLTIEHRGDFPEGTDLHDTFYGCDRCAMVCPHNATPATTDIEEFRPDPIITSLTADEILTMSPERFSTIFRHSAMKRAKLAGLQRNASAMSQTGTKIPKS